MRLYRGWFSMSFLLILLGLLIPATGIAETTLTQNSPQFRFVAQDSQGNLHTVWVSEDGSFSRLYYQTKDASGKSLTDPVLLTETTSRIRRPKVAIDGLNVAHLLWQERFANGAGQKIAQGTVVRYAKLDLTPSGVVSILIRPLTLNTHDSQKAAAHPSLAVDKTGWAYVTWEAGRRNVVLTAIDPSGKIRQTRQISRHATETDHAQPAVAVDRRGNVHVVWTTQSGDKTQLVYKSLRGHGGRVLAKEKIVYTTKGPFAQSKVVTFDQQGNVKIAWANRPAGQKGRSLLGMNTGSGYVLVRSGRSLAANPGSVVAVVDQSVQALPDSNRPLANDAVVNPKPRLNSPAPTVERIAVIHPPILNQSFADQTVSKLLMERVLRYSSWSGPPPADGLSINTPLASYPSVLSLSNNTRLTASNTSLTQKGLLPLTLPSPPMWGEEKGEGGRWTAAVALLMRKSIAVDLEDHQTIQLKTITRGGEDKRVLV